MRNEPRNEREAHAALLSSSPPRGGRQAPQRLASASRAPQYYRPPYRPPSRPCADALLAALLGAALALALFLTF